MLPFTREQFVSVFASYNEAVWPAQIAAYALAAGMLLLLLRRSPAGARALLVGLSIMWIWTGLVYHAMFFSRINPAATVFAVLFVVEGVFIAVSGLRSRVSFTEPSRRRRAAGWALLIYAAVLYPLVGMATGQVGAELPAYGLTPCPLVLTTLGLFLLAGRALPRPLWWIPIGWSLVGGSAAVLLDMPQDWVLLLVPVLLLLGVVHGRWGGRAPADGPLNRRPT
jgi:hypothetical protein